MAPPPGVYAPDIATRSGITARIRRPIQVHEREGSRAASQALAAFDLSLEALQSRASACGSGLRKLEIAMAPTLRPVWIGYRGLQVRVRQQLCSRYLVLYRCVDAIATVLLPRWSPGPV